MLRLLIRQTKNYAEQHTRQYAQAHRYRPSAGIRRQAKAQTNETESESTHWDDDLSKYEGDLTDTSKVLDQYRQESVVERDNLRRSVVRDKYFIETKLSFLTWAEMEQIRMLNTNEPEEWDEHKLVESFPADVAAIRKVLKAKWQPKNSQRIAKHDEKVRLNWKSFVNGDLTEMNHQFSEHLKKFSTRTLKLNSESYDNVLQKEMPKPASTEFLGIITSCKKYQAEPKLITSDNSSTCKQPVHIANESFAPQNIKSHKLYTFKPSNSEENMSVGSEAEIVFDNPTGTGVKHLNNSNEQSSTVNPFGVTKYESNEVQLHPNDLRQLSVASIRNHIDIPEKLFKEGATYRLDDCYYDDDGEFLYRVPGMTKL